MGKSGGGPIRKRWTFSIITILIIVSICIVIGVVGRNSSKVLHPSNYEIYTADTIKMEAEEQAYSSNIASIKTIVTSSVELGSGLDFELEFCKDGRWYTMEMKDTSFISLTGIIAAGTPHEIDYHIHDHYRTPLKAGRYRIVQEFSSEELGICYCAAEFVIQ